MAERSASRRSSTDSAEVEVEPPPIIKYYMGVPVTMRPKKGNRKARERRQEEELMPAPPTPPPSPGDIDPRFPRDRHFDSRSVVALTEYNFDEFVGPKQKVLVYFYDVEKSQNKLMENEFANASDTSLDFHHSYGAVDCFYDARLCERENVKKTPMMKLYSNGFEVSSITYAHEMNAAQIHMLVRMTPILTQSRLNMGKSIQAAKAAAASDDCTPPKRSRLSCIW